MTSWRTILSLVGAAAALLVALPAPAPAEAAPADRALPEGGALMERCVSAWYYAGDDAIAKLRMEIVDRGGGKRYRGMTMLRKNIGEGGEQRYLLYFHEPGDVRRMTCMVLKHAGGDDERWMFVPAANKVRRVAAPERSRFLGSDFTREEFSGRDAAADSHRVARYERLEGHPCWVVESVPRTAVEHSRMSTWVDTTTFLPWKQEFLDRRGEVFRTLTVDKVRAVPGPDGRRIPTIVERTLWSRGRTSRTRLVTQSIRYGVGLRDSDFSEAHLSVALETWYRGARP